MTTAPYVGTGVEVIFVDLTKPDAEVATAASRLSRAELERAARLQYVDDRRRFIRSHAFLRSALAARVGVAPGEIEVVHGTHGKPALSGLQAVHFSMSRAGEVAAFAFAEAAVGIDIVAMDTGNRLREAAPEFCSPDELREVVRLSDLAQVEALARIWARKEALLKATGEGLSRSPATLTVSPREASASGECVIALAGGLWSVEDIVAPRGYGAALAHSASPARPA